MRLSGAKGLAVEGHVAPSLLRLGSRPGGWKRETVPSGAAFDSGMVIP